MQYNACLSDGITIAAMAPLRPPYAIKCKINPEGALSRLDSVGVVTHFTERIQSITRLLKDCPPHETVHNLKKVANRVNAKVVLLAPEKLFKACRLTDPFRKCPGRCLKKHSSPFVACAGAVYQISLTCGRKYVGQTGRSVNDRLRKHNQKVSGQRDGHLSMHCHDRGCKPEFKSCMIISRRKDKTLREIIEADPIKSYGDQCVSVASIDLVDKETQFLRTAAGQGISRVMR